MVITGGAIRGRYNEYGKTEQKLEVQHTGRANSITTVQKDSLCIQAGEAELTWRKLTPLECERLQTVPDGYTDNVSNTQRYRMLGNGWTVEVIKHIFSKLETELKEVK